MAARCDRHVYYLPLVMLLYMVPSIATGQIRLVGPSVCSGRVEVYHNSSWGTVCDDDWDMSDAEVVCRQLDCGTALRTSQAAEFGEGSGQIWLDDVSCSGSESSLTQCGHEGFGTHDCGDGEDAGVVCSGQIRLVGPSSSRCSGRVEVYHNYSWGTVCDDNWDMSEAQVVCRQLDCGTALNATGLALFGQGVGQIWLDDVLCLGHEGTLTQCKGAVGTHNCEHIEDAGVVCSASIPRPSISVSASVVTCSIKTEFPGGMFILSLANQVVQTSDSNPATFTLPHKTFDNEGPYHCLYQTDIFGEFHTSPKSDSIFLHTVSLQFVVSTAAAICVLIVLLLFLLVCLFRERVSRAEAQDQLYAVPQMSYTDNYDKININVKNVKARGACHAEENVDDLPSDGNNEDYENVTEIGSLGCR